MTAAQYADLLIECFIIAAYTQIPQNVRSRKSDRHNKQNIIIINQTDIPMIYHLYQGAGQNPILSAISSKALETLFSKSNHFALHPP